MALFWDNLQELWGTDAQLGPYLSIAWHSMAQSSEQNRDFQYPLNYSSFGNEILHTCLGHRDVPLCCATSGCQLSEFAEVIGVNVSADQQLSTGRGPSPAGTGTPCILWTINPFQMRICTLIYLIKRLNYAKFSLSMHWFLGGYPLQPLSSSLGPK